MLSLFLVSSAIKFVKSDSRTGPQLAKSEPLITEPSAVVIEPNETQFLIVVSWLSSPINPFIELE